MAAPSSPATIKVEIGEPSNGSSPAGVPVAPPGTVQVVDVQHRRYDLATMAMNRVVGKDEAYALARMTPRRRRELAALKLTFALVEGQGLDMTPERELLEDLIKGSLDPRQTYETAIDNLTRQSEEKSGFLKTLLGRG